MHRPCCVFIGFKSTDVSAINWGAIPGVASSHGSGNPDRGIIAVVNGDGDRLVDKPKIPLDANSFVISLRSSMESDLQDVAHRLKNSKKIATGVDNNHTAHSKLQQEFLVEDPSKVVGRNGSDGGLDYEAS